MNLLTRASFLALAHGCLVVPALAQHSHGEGDHYLREPEAVSDPGGIFTEYSVASDAELSVALFKSETDQVVRASVSDGRGLPSTWSAPQDVSATTGSSREVGDTSVFVVDDVAIALWLEDMGGGNRRVLASKYDAGAWGLPVLVNDAGVSPADDVTSFAAVAKPGLNGSPTVAVVYTTDGAGGPGVWLSISASGGSGFGVPVAVSETGAVPGGGAATQVDGAAVDLQLGQLHMAWTDDRDGTMTVYYRRALLTFFGQPIFTAPHGTGDVAISSGDDAVGAPELQVNGELGWSGTNQKYVAIGWREDTASNGNEALIVRSSHDFGDSFNPEAVVAHTGMTDVRVAGFDLEVVGHTFVATWVDNAVDDALGTVTVPVPAVSHVWHAQSSDGTTFDTGLGAIVTRASAFEEADHTGHSGFIAKSAGAPSSSMIAFIEETEHGPEVFTTFADQEFGGAWHIDDYPVVSEAQAKGGDGTAVHPPCVAYNHRYNNYIVLWAQETAAGSNAFEVVVGGYRPHQVAVEGWHLGAPGLEFEIEHLPFEDTFAVVLVSLGGDDSIGGNFLLPDGRKTGIIPDALTISALDPLFFWFSAPNDPIAEGATTPLLPLPPLPLGIELNYCAITWGATGNIHLVTDRFHEDYGPEKPKKP